MSKPQKKRIRGKQQRGTLTRETIILAAIKTLSNSNIYGMRLNLVAKEANVPQSLVDYHFKSLQALVTAVVLFQLEKLKRLSIHAIENHSTQPREALAAYIKAPFELARADIGFRAVWSSYYHLAVVNKEFGDLNRVVRQTGHERIQMLIQNIILSEGRLVKNSGKDTSRVATTIQGLITGCTFIASAETGGDYTHQIEAVIMGCNQLIDVNFVKPT